VQHKGTIADSLYRDFDLDGWHKDELSVESDREFFDHQRKLGVGGIADEVFQERLTGFLEPHWQHGVVDVTCRAHIVYAGMNC
jgi:hypothetical protein